MKLTPEKALNSVIVSMIFLVIALIFFFASLAIAAFVLAVIGLAIPIILIIFAACGKIKTTTSDSDKESKEAIK